MLLGSGPAHRGANADFGAVAARLAAACGPASHLGGLGRRRGRGDPRRPYSYRLGVDADVIKPLDVLSRTTHEELSDAARSWLRTKDGQVNLLLRVVLHPIDRTLASDQANAIRNVIYRAVFEGPVLKLI